MSSAGIPIIRTDGRLYQRILRTLDEFDEEHGPAWIFDKIDALVACACQLLDTIPDARERDEYSVLSATLLRQRRLRFAGNDQ